jgi:hypothetical protein
MNLRELNSLNKLYLNKHRQCLQLTFELICYIQGPAFKRRKNCTGEYS